ncbi:nucleolar protein 8-like [Equus quagga]|uniref:nucleolar protein 8-like n=1 Tax=Equus quagga TaxID=89248 RepID=UPI001EE1999E|nr:nucleolar protein 8-like [Equus quagga]XP_046520351.1 nucleolar protein 8-like [Equus quagga]XP_046520352.1 nucleolar protein 8-like [Equus quagga]XP_046520353.1 nucleolar protein 8-like [Equus quagga]XP_046520354.1 nucleolar protein 8-like [Equus quagga]XP_046520356.1 nucleolar protein 8-like [Equus quagga]XP_046520357.1 nucleolar protein 8-like [Equus quagga]XP_046520358.1 nucleolar protein 8-like [Equus quagga]
MKADRETKRLFVGGLGANISEADLRNQFSRFGEVSDVEIIARKDEQGNLQKVFAYINIRVAEADLKKCMSVLNKTKWKGGTLQIQLAKESFLHRLAQEREEAKAKKEKSRTGNTSLLEKMGVVDFHVKAVPGTEVPGHKNWVVSKFGRVLPVLHLKNQHKRKIIKYDPSKYCHNLKKIGEDFTNATPISNLTWELEGGNDPMSKKRRGEFSDFHSPPKKMITVQKDESSTASLAMRLRPSRVMESLSSTQQQAAQKTPCDLITLPKSPQVPDSESQKLKHVFFQTSGLETTRNRNNLSDDDIDSEDELRLMIAREEKERAIWSSVNKSEDDRFEVVRDDFKSDVHKLHSLSGLGIKNNVSCLDSEDVLRNDSDCDSGDTDEIIAMKKNVRKVKNSTEFSQMEKSIHKKSLKNRKNHVPSDDCIKVHKGKTNIELAISQEVKPLGCKSPSDFSSSENADSISESPESEDDEEYNAMMRNCARVNLTLGDLEQLAGSDLEAPKEDTESDGQETTTKCDRASKSRRTPCSLHTGRQCIHPGEIVASLLKEDNTHGKQKPKANNLKPKFQAFKGIGCLYGKESVKKSMKEIIASNNNTKDQNCLKPEDPGGIFMELGPPYANGSSGELTPFQHAKKANDPTHIQPQKSQDHKVVSPNSSEERSGNPVSSLLPLTGKKSLSLGAKTPKIGSEEDCCHRTAKTGEGSRKRPDLSSCTAPETWPEAASRRDTQGSKTDPALSIKSPSSVNAKDKHAEDNQKRLAALAARQRAREAQKQLVHDALANVDGHPEDKPTHIIFGSDSDSETEEASTQEQSHLGMEPVKESVGRASGKLFDSSDDEESGSEDDSNRFRIKPQFEGRAGQKLMHLQSHFGTDDRFRMDSRFLESDSEEEQEEINEKKTAKEEELAAEKLKALNVVQSVLHINLSNSVSKGSVAAKKFKDIIRYDPTRHDHATYERKRDDKPKESKAKRKKKREETEKLPEVSKEMYYNIATDLKDIFQTTKDASAKEDAVPWNEDCGGEKAEEVHDPAALTTGAEQPGGFTFSFFDADSKDVKEETYSVETLKPGKIAWQGAPRFQDSSSEEDNVTEETDETKPSPGEVSLPEKETTRFFFFSKNDERLHGSALFWRGVGSNISSSSWEARTNNLRMDCQKKHKDAKRRVKPKS